MGTPRFDNSRAVQTTVSVGWALLWMAVFAAVTGVVLMLFYRPSPSVAHASVEAMQSSMPLSIIRGAHHWASALLILGGGAYLMLGLFSGGYRRPLHLVWIAAIGLVCLFLMCQITGHLLPWDAAAVRTAAVETGIAENMPIVGKTQARILRGGDTVGPRTLSIWFAAHVLVLPMVMAGLAWLFILPAHEKGIRLATRPQLIAAVSAMILIAALLVPAPLGESATPKDYGSFDARPEWYVLPLHSLLTVAQSIHPKLAFVGTAVIPTLALAALVALPWIDRKITRHSHLRIVQFAAGVGFVGFLGLCLMSARDMAPLIGTVKETAAQAEVTPDRKVTKLDLTIIAKGRVIFEKSGCLSCHAVAGNGGEIGPPLDGAGVRHRDLDWQIRHLNAPSSVVRGSTMPSYRGFNNVDLQSLATYLLSL